ncbi:MAG: hypothetical protein GY758_33615, partial [Fuerstiella sp.]|nr:hypothetical protein [Fuerstiella sp.]MCP4785180.1 hypothetical protein [Fuerstiella sp.]MCP4858393.1 hypothetical protein [Fuerstiella sp.]
MTSGHTNPRRLNELLVTAANTWVDLGNSTVWTDLFGNWRGTNDLLNFALDFPTQESQDTAKALPGCVVIVEYARWALTAAAPADALSLLVQHANRILESSPDSRRADLVHAFTFTVLAGVAAGKKDFPSCSEHLKEAAILFDRHWALTDLWTALSPDSPLAADGVNFNSDIKDPAHCMLDGMEHCGTFGTSGVTVSTWLVLHRLLSRILGSDNQGNISNNEIKMLLYDRNNRHGQITQAVLEMVKAPRVGAYLDPLSFGVCRVLPSMRNSIRLGFRCCRPDTVAQQAAMRISTSLSVTLGSLSGGSAGPLFAAGMIVTAKQQQLDSTRSATCSFGGTATLLHQPDGMPLEAADLQLKPVAGIVRKINEAWQVRNRLGEIFLHEDDAAVWKIANPGRQQPSVTGITTLDQLVAGMTQNQILDHEIGRHAEEAHAEWDRVRMAIREDTQSTYKDHRFDCYVEPSLRIEGPPKLSEKTDNQSPDSGSEQLQVHDREREEFVVPGDPGADKDKPLLHLLEFYLVPKVSPASDAREELA